jgi:hypothetical protein
MDKHSKSDSTKKPERIGQQDNLEQSLADAVSEFLELQNNEVLVDLDQFCHRYPGLQPQLREQLRVIQQFDELLDPHDTPAAAADSHPSFPAQLSGHRILSQIGAGGMGQVLLAMDERLGRKVAIKMLAPRFADNESLRSRFMHEARAMASINHPMVVRIYNLGPQNEPPHFVMEFVDGVSLTEGARSLSPTLKAELMLKVAQAVDMLHQHNIIHRDLKPGNILVGSDLEPKVLDFGLALQTGPHAARLTLPGEILGTPDYLSPEQTYGSDDLDARSDIFSLGTILYEMLTGAVPFPAASYPEQCRLIREADPILPRRKRSDVPGDLQSICLKAMEKRPEDRYASAQEMAADLQRFLAGEPVLAIPTSFGRMLSGKIRQHLQDLEGWEQDRILFAGELDKFRRLYERLVEREDAWILESRRLTLPQVSLYLGAWFLIVGAALLVLFNYHGLSGYSMVALSIAATVPSAWAGLRIWRQEHYRIAVAYLLAFCMLLPITWLVAMGEWGWFASLTQNRNDLELFSKLNAFKLTTNAQLWWALLLSFPAYLWVRRFTKSSVFSLVLAFMAALFCMVTLLRFGMIQWLEEDPGKFYFRLMPFAGVFFAIGFILERLAYSFDSRYFYPIAVVFCLSAFSGVAAFHEPYAKWLQETIPITRGQIEYLFMINAIFYWALQSLCERFETEQTRWVARSFRFVIPGHVMTSMLLLGIAAYGRWQDELGNSALRSEARFFELALPIVACCFVFGSIPKQMKNYFVTGLLFLAAGIIRLQQDLLRDVAAWPISLLILGLSLMLLAARYPAIRLSLRRIFRKHRTKTGPDAPA